MLFSELEDSDSEPVRLEDLSDAQAAVKAFQVSAKWFPEQIAEAEEMASLIEGIWSSTGREAERSDGAPTLTQKKSLEKGEK